MSRYTDLDSDEHRLPPGFTRTGYDSTTQTYTFLSPEGTLYESLPGQRYGSLYPVGQRPVPTAEEVLAQDAVVKKAHNESMRMLLPFVLLVLVFMGLLFKFLSAGGSGEALGGGVQCAEGVGEVRVSKGDTCWVIAEGRGISVEDLLALGGNQGINCEKLEIGQRVCVPA